MAQFKQERHVALVSGANQAFVITNQMLSASLPTELPTLAVFVVNIADSANPKADTLARVATLADLTTIPIGRDAGVATPGPDGAQFLSPSWTASYDALQTALDAAQAFRDRVNQLIVDWQSFRTTFNAPDPTPAVYTFPTGSSSQLTTLIAAYKAAKQDRYQKQIDKADADTAFTLAQADYTYKSGLVTGLVSMVSLAVQNVSEFTTASGYFSSLKSAGDTFAAANPGGTGITTFQAALNLAATRQSQIAAYLGDASTLSTTVSAYQTARTTAATAAGVVLAAATTDQATKTTALTAARSLESTTLAAVIAVCPDFNKHSIPFVDDTEP